MFIIAAIIIIGLSFWALKLLIKIISWVVHNPDDALTLITELAKIVGTVMASIIIMGLAIGAVVEIVPLLS